MVRITMQNRDTGLQWKVEGRLAGEWVPELEHCWRCFLAHSPHTSVVVDLTDTEYVDLAGRYLLALMCQSGMKLTANSPYMKAVISEIVDSAV